jgi:hypothetical protein
VWIDTLSTADRVNLLELYGRSVMLLELGRATEWADLFELYAQVRCVESVSANCADTRGQSARQYKGRVELIELARRMIAGEFDLAAGELTPASRCRHTLSNISFFAESAQGTASGYAHFSVTTAGGAGGAGVPRWLASGLYADKLRRCGAGCWRFESRVLTLDGGAVGHGESRLAALDAHA